MARLGGVVPGERLCSSLPPSAALLGQESQGSAPWVLELHEGAREKREGENEAAGLLMSLDIASPSCETSSSQVNKRKERFNRNSAHTLGQPSLTRTSSLPQNE